MIEALSGHRNRAAALLLVGVALAGCTNKPVAAGSIAPTPRYTSTASPASSRISSLTPTVKTSTYPGKVSTSVNTETAVSVTTTSAPPIKTTTSVLAQPAQSRSINVSACYGLKDYAPTWLKSDSMGGAYFDVTPQPSSRCADRLVMTTKVAIGALTLWGTTGTDPSQNLQVYDAHINPDGTLSVKKSDAIVGTAKCTANKQASLTTANGKLTYTGGAVPACETGKFTEDSIAVDGAEYNPSDFPTFLGQAILEHSKTTSPNKTVSSVVKFS